MDAWKREARPDAWDESVSTGCLSKPTSNAHDTAKVIRKYSPKKVTHGILVHRQVQIIVAVNCVLYISYVIEYKE